MKKSLLDHKQSIQSLYITTKVDNLETQALVNAACDFINELKAFDIKKRFKSHQSYIDTCLVSYDKKIDKYYNDLSDEIIRTKMDLTRQIYDKDLPPPININPEIEVRRPSIDEEAHDTIYQYLFDNNTGCYYFYNTQTGITSWDPPEDLDIIIYHDGQKLDGGYTVCRTSEGKLYKRNDITGSIELLYN